MGGKVSKAPRPQPLSMEQLLRVRKRLKSWRKLTPELKACFDRALSEFAQEPQCIQENAKMTIQCGLTALVFISGSQENEIHVFCVKGQAQYHIKTATTPEPLSVEQLLCVRARLESRKRLTPELQACFNLALSEFSQEPLYIQQNARLTIQCGPMVLLFKAGTQDNKIHVFQVGEQVQYNINVARWDAFLARACSRVTVKSVVEMANYVPVGLPSGTLKKFWNSCWDLLPAK